MLSMQGIQVLSLVEELRSHMLSDAAKRVKEIKIKKKKKKKTSVGTDVEKLELLCTAV